MTEFIGLPGIDKKKIDEYYVFLTEESDWLLDEMVANFGINKSQADQILKQIFKQLVYLFIDGKHLEFKDLFLFGIFKHGRKFSLFFKTNKFLKEKVKRAIK